MEIDFLLRRQAVCEWRDRHLFQAVSTINCAAIKARADFDAQLEEAGFADTVWDPEAFAFGRIDTLMRKHLAGSLNTFLTGAADELRLIEGRFGPLADALASSSSALVLPVGAAVGETATGQAAPSEQSPCTAAEAKPAEPETGFQRLSGLVREWGSRASENIVSTAETVSKSVQDRTGLYDRLRRKAAERIKGAWMGDGGDPLPLKVQLIGLIEDVTSEARSINL